MMCAEAPTPPATPGDDGWNEDERVRRQEGLGIDTRGEKLTRHEIEFVERFHRAGHQLEWIPRDKTFRSTNDFVWSDNDRREVELKSTKARHQTIHGQIVKAASRAAKHGVVKENFVIDIGNEPMTDALTSKLSDFNAGRRKYRLKGLWVMSQGHLHEIELRD